MAIGVDTTGRVQTAWRVGLMPLPAVVVAGKVTSGSFSAGDLVTQASTGATAVVIGAVPAAGPMTLSLVSGTPDASNVWSNTSGGQFTPTAAPVGDGCVCRRLGHLAERFKSGEVVVQSGTGASATLSEAVPAAGPMIVSAISGAPAALGSVDRANQPRRVHACRPAVGFMLDRCRRSVLGQLCCERAGGAELDRCDRQSDWHGAQDVGRC